MLLETVITYIETVISVLKPVIICISAYIVCLIDKFGRKYLHNVYLALFYLKNITLSLYVTFGMEINSYKNITFSG